MILKNRAFERAEPTRKAQKIYIFCEGAKREYQYFQYFEEIDSRIELKPYKLDPHENNSPKGMLSIAINCIDGDKENDQQSKYSFLDDDEVWIVIDTDPDEFNSRVPQILQVATECKKRDGWYLAQSNPCFEVWLYYHFYDSKPQFEGMETCTHWKQHVNNSVKGGFNSKKHPNRLEKAINNAKITFESNSDGSPQIGSTDVFRLFEGIFDLLKNKLEQRKNSSTGYYRYSS